MKMRLQIASVLPAPAKAEPLSSQGKGMFGATLQGMLTMPETARTQLGAIGTRPSKSAQLETNVEVGKPGFLEELTEPLHRITEGAQSGSPASGSLQAQRVDQREQIEGSVVPQPGADGWAVSKEPLTGPEVQAPTIEQAIVQSSIVNMRQITPETDLIRQPGAGAKPYRTTLTKDASPHLAHKAEEMHDQLNPAAAQSSGMAAPVLLVSDLVVPITTEQLQGSHSSPSQPASNIVSSSRVRGQNQSGRISVQSVVTSRAAASSRPSAAVGSQLLAPASAAAATGGGENPGGPRSAAANRIAGLQPTSPNPEKSSATVVTSATRPLESKAAHSVAEGREGAAAQTDARTVKDVGQKIGTEVKSEIKLSMPAQLTPGSATVEHDAAPNLSPANHGHAIDKGIATHRPDASAAQMLQRMDMAASPGVVQLRADARRLDVGVSSGTLGWVEVRATAGPSGRVDATLQAQNDASAHVLAGQSSEISSYAREHSVQLGQVSVGVGTGGGTQGESRSNYHGSRDENATPTGDAVRTPTNTEQADHIADAVSLISVRV